MRASVVFTIFSLAFAISAYPQGNAANANPNGCGTGLGVSKKCSSTSSSSSSSTTSSRFSTTSSSTSSKKTSSSSTSSSSTSSSSPSSTSYVAMYDDIDANAVSAQANNISIYRGLLYRSWTVSNKSNSATGVQEQSFPNVLVTEVKTQLRGGGIPSVTTQYSGSQFSSFTPSYFYSGCNENTQNSQVTLPTTCMITVNGYQYGTLVASQNYTYNPPLGAVTAPLQQFFFPPGFDRVANVTFQQGDPTMQVLYLEDFAVTLFA